ncbi:hypothetical protein FHS19_000656 [Paenibacillus rhizosphaerae]|uniref:Uncharacterized protein n=1 Tax=Paenibacillus rhizosphaerae TaxID=297318 RepID=A0A839THB4_9BACL|nr:hypothetical protein [Paenibacillus rhizosphaerae]
MIETKENDGLLGSPGGLSMSSRCSLIVGLILGER